MLSKCNEKKSKTVFPTFFMICIRICLWFGKNILKEQRVDNIQFCTLNLAFSFSVWLGQFFTRILLTPTYLFTVTTLHILTEHTFNTSSTHL